MMGEYRSPEDELKMLVQRARVSAVVSAATIDTGHLFAAMYLDEPQDVVELWCDRVWDGIREGLAGTESGERSPDWAAAIVLLIEDRARALADSLIEVEE